jgi:hypothetical protein
MWNRKLKDRVAKLESEVAKLKTQIGPITPNRRSPARTLYRLARAGGWLSFLPSEAIKRLYRATNTVPGPV